MVSSDDADEDDYLTMTFDDKSSTAPPRETYSQRRARKLREHEDQSHIKPAKVLEQERREEGLAQNLFAESSMKETKAMRMMKLMGYTEGKALGSGESAGHIEPIAVEIPEGRRGIGHENEKKRKLKDLYEDSVKRQKDDPETYRINMRSERLRAKLETDFLAAQKVCQNLDIKAAGDAGTEVVRNILWRGLERDREMQHKDILFRNRLMYERRPNLLEDSDSEEYSSFVETLEDEDEELNEFEALPLENKMDMVLHYMRQTYWYCFWCGYAYADADDLAENCPGVHEDDH